MWRSDDGRASAGLEDALPPPGIWWARRTRSAETVREAVLVGLLEETTPMATSEGVAVAPRVEEEDEDMVESGGGWWAVGVVRVEMWRLVATPRATRV